MATSGSYDWNRTRDQICEAALRKIGALGQGQTATAVQMSEAVEALNARVKAWRNDGIRLWKLDWLVHTLTASSEVVGSDALNYTCVKGHTGVTAVDKPITAAGHPEKWIVRGSSGVAWTETAHVTIGEMTPVAGIIGIERLIVRSDMIDHNIVLISGEEYANISDKYVEGLPIKAWFDHRNNKVHLYPYPDDLSDIIRYRGVYALEDFDAAGDDPDMEARWVEPLIYDVAHALSPEYGLPLGERRLLKAEADALKKLAIGTDTETQDSNSVEPAY